MELILQCEMCTAEIGVFDSDKIKKPFTAAMFGSMMPEYDVPPPFHEDLDWETMRCPMCRIRPFLTEDYVMTPFGKHEVGGNKEEDDKSRLYCKNCGRKDFKSAAGRSSHERRCE